MDFLTFQASIRPNSLAVNDLTHQRQWSYQQFDLLIAKVVTLLNQQGLSQGERLACLSKNRAEIITLHLACARIGAIFVPLNWRLVTEEIDAILADCDPKLLYADEQGDVLDLDYLPINAVFKQSANLSAAVNTQIDMQLPSLILYTSGTTGKPKGVMLSEQNLTETAINFALLGEVDCHSAFLCESPMFHIIGLVTSVRPALFHGASLIISDAFIPPRTLARLSEPTLAITHYFCVPQMANALRNDETFNPANLKGLKAVFTGGAPHPEVQIRRWLHDGIPIVDGYGLSEAGTVFGMPVDSQLIDKKAGCVGVATHRVQVRLVDEQTHEVGVGHAGEVQLKGENITLGYWRREAEYQAAMTDDGWFKTGDIAVKDEDGYFRIVDRKKDMFISGGENVYPTEVEAVVLKHPAIQECAMIGIPDKVWGEVGCLFVVLRKDQKLSDKQVLLDFLMPHLARYKLPKHLIIKPALPRNGGGKVLKHVLRATMTVPNV